MCAYPERLPKVKVQAMAVECLRHLKSFFTYRELSKELGFPEAVLCRYVRGDMVPGPERAWQIVCRAAEVDLLGRLVDRVLVLDESGVVNIYFIAYDRSIVSLAAQRALVEFLDLDVSKVLTAAVNGIPLAVAVSNALDVDVAVAKGTRDAGVVDYLEAEYMTPSPPTLRSLYLPKGAVRRGDRVLIVDDLLHSGRTLSALSSLTEKSGGVVVGVFALISVGESWRALVPQTVEKVVVVREIALS